VYSHIKKKTNLVCSRNVANVHDNSRNLLNAAQEDMTGQGIVGGSEGIVGGSVNDTTGGVTTEMSLVIL